jgi:hypothetical protein
MAAGDMVRAKKLYCGVGPDADAYEVKRRQFRKEILEDLSGDGRRQSGGALTTKVRAS